MKKVLLPAFAAILVAVGLGPMMAVGAGALDKPAAAPALEVTEWVKGEPVKVDEGKGESIYVVEFWATWCPPCRESIPHLTELQEKYAEKGVIVVGVTDEEPETVKPFVEKMGEKMEYRVAVDTERATHKAFNKIVPFRGIPTAFVIDKSGNVVWSGHPMGELGDVLEDLTSKGSGDSGAA